jgi:DNA-binding response OmpR family regulator
MPYNTNAATCPCCGRPFESPSLKVDINRNSVVTPMGRASLTPMEAEILYALWSHGRPLTILSLLGYVYGQRDEPGNGSACIRVTVSKMRKALKDIGVVITKGSHAGYMVYYDPVSVQPL